MDKSTKPEDILDTFQNRNQQNRKTLADECLRGEYRRWPTHREERTNLRANETKDSILHRVHQKKLTPNKAEEPQRFGDPVKHSIKEISEEELSGWALLKAAWQEYRRRLTHFKTRSERPIERDWGFKNDIYLDENSVTPPVTPLEP